MSKLSRTAGLLVLGSAFAFAAAACVASGSVGIDHKGSGGSGGGGGTGAIDGGGGGTTICSNGNLCVGNAVHACDENNQAGALIETCDTAAGEVCSNGACRKGCEVAEEFPSNLGCEFYAVDLDLSDGVSDPGGGPWGVALANAGQSPALVTIEKDDAPLGSPSAPSIVFQGTIEPGDLAEVTMPTREVDCAVTPGDWYAPGTCLSRNAFRITSTSPIVVYQFNNLTHGYSTDASLLLPTTSLGRKYRVLGWPTAHSFKVPFPIPGDPWADLVQRAYVTIVGTVANTQVTVHPSWRIKGNPPIPATPKGQSLTMTIGPFEVLNLESDDATLEECLQMSTPPYCADMTGTIVEASEPVVVFSGTEQSGIGLPHDAEKPPSWTEDKGCCNQHLEEQLLPIESFGKNFIVTRSALRSNPQFTWWEEPDILRFMGVAAPAEVTTNLPAPLDKFTLQPGEVRETYSDKNVVVSSTEPIAVAQFLLSQDYVEPQPKGDPSFTVFPAIEQARTEYVFLALKEWDEHWVVIATEKTTEITIDGAPAANCKTAPAGTLGDKEYESRTCPLTAGVHRISGNAPFQMMAYGYASADAYSFPGGANVKKIYEPPPIPH